MNLTLDTRILTLVCIANPSLSARMIARAVLHDWVDCSEGKMERVMAHPKGFR